jgi:hypothetical protein
MRLSTLLKTALAVSIASSAAPEAYPKPVDPNQISAKQYVKSDKIKDLKCIQRQIDTGEHKFDAENNIIYGDFPSCIETGEPLALTYATNEQFNCSFVLTDETYHLFQLYIHEDTPFSCRLHDHKDNTGGFIPLTFNLRGNLESSHLDIDTRLNIIGTYNKVNGSIGSLVGYSSGSSTSKYIIGDKITLQINSGWFPITNEEFYTVSSDYSIGFWTVLLIGGVSSFITGTILIWALYDRVTKKALKSQQFGIEQSKYD